MGNCSGLHCPGCGSGGGGGLKAGAVAGLVAVALVMHYASAVGRAVSEVVTVLAITAASTAGLALTAGTMAAVVKIRRARVRRVLARAGEPREIPAAAMRVLPPARPPLSRPVTGRSRAGRWAR